MSPQQPFRRQPKRVMKVREFLLAAQRTAIEPPVGAFVDALLELEITDEGAREAIDEAKRLYFNQDGDAS